MIGLTFCDGTNPTHLTVEQFWVSALVKTGGHGHIPRLPGQRLPEYVHTPAARHYQMSLVSDVSGGQGDTGHWLRILRTQDSGGKGGR